MEKIKSRLSEASTYAGLSGILLGLNQLVNMPNVPEVAAVVAKAGVVASGGGGFMLTIGTLIAGLLAVFIPEKQKAE